jgi:hypothetical protein
MIACVDKESFGCLVVLHPMQNFRLSLFRACEQAINQGFVFWNSWNKIFEPFLGFVHSGTNVLAEFVCDVRWMIFYRASTPQLWRSATRNFVAVVHRRIDAAHRLIDLLL